MLISKSKMAVIHIARQELGLDDGAYRDILKQEAGVTSSTKLNDVTFGRVMKRFEKLGYESKQSKQKKQRPGSEARDAEAVPSESHLEMINMLYDQLGWEEGPRRIGFNKRMIKKSWPQTRAEANKIIEALKSMVARSKKKV